MRIRDFQSGPEVAWLISDPPLWPRVQFVGRTVRDCCDRLEKYPVSVLPNFLKTADFPLFKLSIHSKRISTEKFLGSFSLVQSVEKFQWMFEKYQDNITPCHSSLI